MALTPKQERFVAEYLVDLNATQAAIRAGYSEHTAKAQGSRLLTKADVCEAVERAGRHVVERAIGSASYIVETATKAADGALQAKQYSAVASNLAILARRHPEFSEKHDVSGDIRIQALTAVAQLSTEELKLLVGDQLRALREPED